MSCRQINVQSVWILIITLWLSLLAGVHTAHGDDASSSSDTFPLSWIHGSVEVALHGVFRANEKTEEGFISKEEAQYKVLISYTNISNKSYQPSGANTAPSVGYLVLMTASGKAYSPKYIGGNSLPFRLGPGEIYETHNYAFNIDRNEIPFRLDRYVARNDVRPVSSIQMAQLIEPPTPRGERMVKIGEQVLVGNFVFRPVKFYTVSRLLKGPFVGDRFGVFQPRKRVFHILLSHAQAL